MLKEIILTNSLLIVFSSIAYACPCGGDYGDIYRPPCNQICDIPCHTCNYPTTEYDACMPNCYMGSMYSETDYGYPVYSHHSYLYNYDNFSWDRRTGDDIGADMNIDY